MKRLPLFFSYILGSGCFIPHCVVLILLCKLCTCSCLLEATRKAASPEVHFEEFCVGFKEFFQRLDKIKAEREALKPFAFREHLLVLIQLNKVFIPTKNKPDIK